MYFQSEAFSMLVLWESAPNVGILIGPAATCFNLWVSLIRCWGYIKQSIKDPTLHLAASLQDKSKTNKQASKQRNKEKQHKTTQNKAGKQTSK